MASLLSLSLLERGLSGLRSVTDDGEALLSALEAYASQGRAPRHFRLTRADAESALRTYRTQAAAARALGVPRTTLRDALRGALRGAQ